MGGNARRFGQKTYFSYHGLVDIVTSECFDCRMVGFIQRNVVLIFP